jgi:hypothetical protein
MEQRATVDLQMPVLGERKGRVWPSTHGVGKREGGAGPTYVRRVAVRGKVARMRPSGASYARDASSGGADEATIDFTLGFSDRLQEAMPILAGTDKLLRCTILFPF